MLASIWLPTLLSAVAVFIISAVVHMALPAWHASDYPKLPNEGAVLDALRPLDIPPGEYMAPRPTDGNDMRSPEFLAKMNQGPVLILNVHRPGFPWMGRPLLLWFVFTIIVSLSAGMVARAALGTHDDPRDIFHAVVVTAFMGYTFALWPQVIWYRRPALTAFKATIDGAVYALVTAMIFVKFWPAS